MLAYCSLALIARAQISNAKGGPANLKRLLSSQSLSHGYYAILFIN